LVADCQSSLARWRKHFPQLFSEHGFSDVRQTEIHTAEPLVPEPSAVEFDLAIEKLKSHKSPSIYRIPTELFKAGGRIIRYEIHKHIIAIWKKEELPEEWKEWIVVPVYKNGDKTYCSNYRGILFCQLPTKVYPTSSHYIFCIRKILEKEMEIQQSSASGVYRIQESFGFD